MRLKDFLLVIAVPVAQLFFLTTAFDFHAPAFVHKILMLNLVVLPLFIFITVRECVPLGFNKGWFALNVLVFGMFLFLIYGPYASGIASPAGQNTLFLLFGYTLITVIACTGFSIFVKPAKWIEAINGQPVPFSVLSLAIGSQWIYFRYAEALWLYLLSGPTTKVVLISLKALGYEMMPSDHPFRLVHALFSVRIYGACSGLEGVVFFITVLSLVVMVDHKRFSGAQIFVSYGAGIIYMWLLNVLRIVLIFIAGVYTSERWGREEATNLVVKLFHANTGWVLYSAGIALFMAALFKIMGYNNPPPSPSLRNSGG